MSEKFEQAEDQVAVGAGIGHDLSGVEGAVVVEQPVEDVLAVAERAGDDEVGPADVVVGDVVEERDAAAGAEVAGVGPGGH